MHDQETVEKAMRLYARAVGILDTLRVQAWKQLDITVTQLRVLFILRDTAGAPAGFLAEHLRVTPPTVTGLVDRLVRMGFVRREEDPEDRRLVRNYLTERGLRVVGEVEREGRAFLSKVFDRLSPEQMNRLVASLEDLVTAAMAVEPVETATG